MVESDASRPQPLFPEGVKLRPVLSLARNERDRIAQALARSGGNRNRAAHLLGISRATIYRKIKQYHL